MRILGLLLTCGILSGCVGTDEINTLDNAQVGDDVPRVNLVNQPNDSAQDAKQTGGFASLFKRSKPTTAEAQAHKVASAGGGGAFGVVSGRVANQITETATGQVAFGRMVKVCNLTRRDRGTRIARRGGFKLYDTAPNSITPRRFFVTGFQDRCARKFTAAMAFLGDPLLHEAMRYSRKSKYSKVENAYEGVKKRICGASRGRHCKKNTERLQSTTTFVSVYQHFGASHVGGTALLHRGRIVSSDFAN